MGTDNRNQSPANDSKNEVHYKGTFIAVMLLGVFMVVTWFAVYALFLSR